MTDQIEIGEGTVPKRTFVRAIHWPGWCLGGMDPLLAPETPVATARAIDPMMGCA